VSDPSAQGLFSAEHRALRELYAMARQLSTHWERLADRLGGGAAEALTGGAAGARELLRELEDRTAPHGLYGFPAAQGVGGRLADLRNYAGDLVPEHIKELARTRLNAWRPAA
jgi:hypothetical protein